MLFRLTTKLGFEEARTIDELSLVRERSVGQKSTYDIGDLRLDFRVTQEGMTDMIVRFDPENTIFCAGSHKLFDFEQLMFDSTRCIEIIRKGPVQTELSGLSTR